MIPCDWVGWSHADFPHPDRFTVDADCYPHPVPNLLLWTGGRHVLVLMVKED